VTTRGNSASDPIVAAVRKMVAVKREIERATTSDAPTRRSSPSITTRGPSK
jgi:hypothetical protein